MNVSAVPDETGPGWTRSRPGSHTWRRSSRHARRAGRGSVSATRLIDASPERLWRMVSDVTRMGEWSPEITSARWISRHHAPVVGARFVGLNHRRWRRWATTCRVVEATPGTAFAFEVRGGPWRVSRWSYHFELDGNRTRVTETWTDQRGWFMRKISRWVTGVKDRPQHNRESMIATLNALARAASPG